MQLLGFWGDMNEKLKMIKQKKRGRQTHGTKMKSWKVFYVGGYSSDKNSLFTWPVYFHVLPSSSLQYTWLIIHDTALINP